MAAATMDPQAKKAPFVSSATVFLSFGFLIAIGAFAVYSSPAWALGAVVKKGRVQKQRNSIRRVSNAGKGERSSADGASASRGAEAGSWLSVLQEWGLDLGFGAGATDDSSLEGEDLWYGEELVGYGPFNCTAQDVQDQAQDWSSAIGSNAGRWAVHCAGNNVSRAIHRVSPSRLGKVFLDIGANKGYLLAHWFALWAPELGINERALAPYWSKTKRVDYACGPCKDCEEPPAETAALYAGRDPEGPLGSAADIRAFALEALPATHEALAAAPVWASAAPGVVTILNLAGDEKAGSVLFGKCNVASEVCTIEKDGSNAVSVPSVSVDKFREEHNIGDIFWLTIDTEGNDPAVLRGAEATLREGAIQVLEFEYNGERGLWKDPSVLLAPIIAHLDDLRYTCFLESSHKLFLLSRCWTPGFEWKAWSNVVCAHQRSGAILDALLAQTMLWERIVERGRPAPPVADADGEQN